MASEAGLRKASEAANAANNRETWKSWKGKRHVPQGVSLKAGRFHAHLSWNGITQNLGLFATLPEAVAARYAAEQAIGWPGAKRDRGKTLEQRQREAVEQFGVEGEQALAASAIAHRVQARLRLGWCRTCAETRPAGSRRPKDCGSVCGKAQAKSPERPGEGRRGATRTEARATESKQ